MLPSRTVSSPPSLHVGERERRTGEPLQSRDVGPSLCHAHHPQIIWKRRVGQDPVFLGSKRDQSFTGPTLELVFSIPSVTLVPLGMRKIRQTGCKGIRGVAWVPWPPLSVSTIKKWLTTRDAKLTRRARTCRRRGDRCTDTKRSERGCEEEPSWTWVTRGDGGNTKNTSVNKTGVE